MPNNPSENEREELSSEELFNPRPLRGEAIMAVLKELYQARFAIGETVVLLASINPAADADEAPLEGKIIAYEVSQGGITYMVRWCDFGITSHAAFELEII